MIKNKNIILCILDGWGVADENSDNAIFNAKTPNWDRIIDNYPNTKLKTSGLDVGLPDGQMGNSEVGHMNIGSGRIVMQNLPKIDSAILDGSFIENAALQKLIDCLVVNGRACHLMGLISDGGVHSHINHIIELAKVVSSAGVKVHIHAFLDGRDTPPQSAAGYIGQLNGEIINYDDVNIATVSGRYYAMDRDKRWARVELAYNAIVCGEGVAVESAEIALEDSYTDNKSDEFVIPSVIADYEGMNDGDALIMANFRSDRAREILTSMLDSKFDGFVRKKVVKCSNATGMVEYSDELNEFMTEMFPSSSISNTLGQIISDRGMQQLRIAETEKYAHVTFFFNGGLEGKFEGEDRILVQSPSVATYDKKPEMSSEEVTDKLIESIDSKKYNLIVANYANGDMVGHTGVMSAAIKAVEAVDNAIGKLCDTAENANAVLIITADHGNAEKMLDVKSHKPHTAHTLYPVPFVIIGNSKDIRLKSGKLCDISPTILELMNIQKPIEMTGSSLILNRL